MVRVLDTLVIQGNQVQHLGAQIGAQTELDRFSGTVLQASLNISGQIVDMWVNKGPEGNNLDIPASVSADGHTFEVGIKGKFTGNVTTVCGMEVVVKDPDGVQRAAPAIDWAAMNPGNQLNWEYNIYQVQP